MGQLYVYEPWPDAVDTMGLCGPLTPKKATCTQEKNGDFRLDIEHPIDPAGKWAWLSEMRLIKADVPMRTTPIIKSLESAADHYPSAIDRMTVKTGLTRDERSVYTAPLPYPNITAPIRLEALSEGESVYLVGSMAWAGYPWSLVVWTRGRGWIKDSSLTLAETIAVSATRAAIERIIPSPRTRPQLFRIDGVKPSDGGVTVSARHVSYDYAGILSTEAAGSYGPGTAVSVLDIGEATEIDKHVEAPVFYNITGTIDAPGWSRVGIVEAVLAPSNGITGLWPSVAVRDNWSFSFLSDAQYASGYRIEYGKNLKSINVDVDYNGIQDALMVIGQTVKGKPLVVPNNYYTVDGQTIQVRYGGCVLSPNYTYPIPHMAVLDLGSSIKAAGTTSAQLNAAYIKLIRAALAEFANKQCDLPPFSLNVDFLNLGDAAEYARYKDLQKVFVCDVVTTKHPRLNVDVTTQINKTVWNCLANGGEGAYDSVELGSVRRNYARSRLAPWQVPGLASLQSYVDTISSLI